MIAGHISVSIFGYLNHIPVATLGSWHRLCSVSSVSKTLFLTNPAAAERIMFNYNTSSARRSSLAFGCRLRHFMLMWYSRYGCWYGNYNFYEYIRNVKETWKIIIKFIKHLQIEVMFYLISYWRCQIREGYVYHMADPVITITDFIHQNTIYVTSFEISIKCAEYTTIFIDKNDFFIFLNVYLHPIYFHTKYIVNNHIGASARIGSWRKQKCCLCNPRLWVE